MSVDAVTGMTVHKDAEDPGVDVATPDLAKAMVATGAAISVDLVILTVAVVGVAEPVVFSGFPRAFIIAMPEEEVALLHGDRLGIVIGTDGIVVVTTFVPKESGEDLILNICGPVKGCGVLIPGIFCCKAPTALTTS